MRQRGAGQGDKGLSWSWDEQGPGEKQGKDVWAEGVGGGQRDREHRLSNPRCLSVFQRKASRHVKGEDRHKASSRSIGLDTATSQPAGQGAPPGGIPPPSRAPWVQGPALPGLGLLRDLDDGPLDQEDGVTQVTCM